MLTRARYPLSAILARNILYILMYINFIHTLHININRTEGDAFSLLSVTYILVGRRSYHVGETPRVVGKYLYGVESGESPRENLPWFSYSCAKCEVQYKRRTSSDFFRSSFRELPSRKQNFLVSYFAPSTTAVSITALGFSRILSPIFPPVLILVRARTHAWKNRYNGIWPVMNFNSFFILNVTSVSRNIQWNVKDKFPFYRLMWIFWITSIVNSALNFYRALKLGIREKQ